MSSRSGERATGEGAKGRDEGEKNDKQGDEGKRPILHPGKGPWVSIEEDQEVWSKVRLRHFSFEICSHFDTNLRGVVCGGLATKAGKEGGRGSCGPTSTASASRILNFADLHRRPRSSLPNIHPSTPSPASSQFVRALSSPHTELTVPCCSVRLQVEPLALRDAQRDSGPLEPRPRDHQRPRQAVHALRVSVQPQRARRKARSDSPPTSDSSHVIIYCLRSKYVATKARLELATRIGKLGSLISDARTLSASNFFFLGTMRRPGADTDWFPDAGLDYLASSPSSAGPSPSTTPPPPHQRTRNSC